MNWPTAFFLASCSIPLGVAVCIAVWGKSLRMLAILKSQLDNYGDSQ